LTQSEHSCATVKVKTAAGEKAASFLQFLRLARLIAASL
jgi:hypothetical protein